MTITYIIITLLYLFLIGRFVFGFDKVKIFRLEDVSPKTKFTVVIPFRNEAKNLPELLDSVLKLNYPKALFEIIFVDDESDDDSVEQIMRFLTSFPNDSKLINNIRVTNSPKKDAISTAILHAKSDWIITTDADCVLPKYWLDGYDNFIQKNNATLIAGPVSYNNTNGFLNAFQTLDFLSLIGATIGGFGINKPFLSNGANMAYKKDFFISVNGFEGNTNIASGDDIFLLEKAIKQNPKEVHYLKCTHAIVSTNPEPTVSKLIAQRVRWASKTSYYTNSFAKAVGLLVLIANAISIIGLVLTFLGLLKFKVFAYLFFIKIAIDFLLLYKTSQFFSKESVLKHYLWCGLLYPFFSVYIAFISMFTSYKWKGRHFKK
ncbi:glycosyltransferase [Olleya sp. R77988]|uniref:glycosyltransferase n=1 Tax=Olleya sp. R77988 TaxID=3093875 RepID=UPI0037C71DC8